MFWVAAGFLVLGAACGAVFRLLFFAAVLLVAAAVVVASDMLRGSPNVFIDAVIAVVALQIGYAVGIALRATIYARRHRQSGIKASRVRYPVESPRERR
jgi:hypothetical protein